MSSIRTWSQRRVRMLKKTIETLIKEVAALKAEIVGMRVQLKLAGETQEKQAGAVCATNLQILVDFISEISWLQVAVEGKFLL